MAKKQSSRKDTLPQGPVISVKNPFTPEKIATLESVLCRPAPSNAFDKWIDDSGVEVWTKQTLKNAGLPAHLCFFPEGKALPEGRRAEGIQGFMAFVEARGFREGKDKEWHSAALLRLIWLARGFARLGDADYAAIYALELGALLQEGAIWFSYRKQRQDAGSNPKRNPDLASFIRLRRHQDSELSQEALWEEICDYDENEPLRFKGCELFGERKKVRIRGRLESREVITINRDGKEKSITLPSFKRYFTNAK